MDLIGEVEQIRAIDACLDEVRTPFEGLREVLVCAIILSSSNQGAVSTGALIGASCCGLLSQKICVANIVMHHIMRLVGYVSESLVRHSIVHRRALLKS